ncbi:MAG: winged helix-turn-helix transcriptional regulator [Bacteroidetes bacterium]|jgi:DNA-binding HxlR family transcriptional regulator|nr:winged helix-turn-helix transcriptional regulator [Bacteroidota bacterium]MBX7128326.1 helix-turn-helix transcriptional regulator [Flavobacteriales bacterium]MCC6656538.1 winged helix-turn-helix transcriptional regulator [Flavobacteriales bacterium]HMW98200.1 helix-turn-helix domain-containing protein [Flavobacteriales bacterium]HMZ49217.1 helix-turn-helix domain-containing protein [Flavobacteriales bacterium]
MVIDGDEYRIRLNGHVYHCALDVTMELVGGKWKTIVLWYLRKDKKRFSELRKLIPGITEKMLSLQLRQLEKDGFVSRKVYPEVPPRVEYALTAHGRTLLPLLEEIAAWGRMMGKKYGSVEKVDRPAKKKAARKNVST